MVIIIYKNKILIVKCLNKQKVFDFYMHAMKWKKKKKKLLLISIVFNLSNENKSRNGFLDSLGSKSNLQNGMWNISKTTYVHKCHGFINVYVCYGINK